MQPCSQPREGLIERSKEMSDDSLRVMLLRVESMVTVVLNGGNSSKLCQPSSKALRASGSKRPAAFDCAPRPRRRPASTATSASGGAARSTVAGRHGAATCARPWRAKAPAGGGEEGVGDAGGRLAAEGRAMDKS